MIARFLLLGLCLWPFVSSRAAEVTPGERPPRDLKERARPAMEKWRSGLAAKDEVAVRAAVAEVIAVLGPWAGNPERVTLHFPAVNPAPYDVAAAREGWMREIKRAVKGFPWHKNLTGNPRLMQAGLREAAWPLASLARVAPLFPDQREAIVAEVRAGSEWLLARQAQDGVFPFPIGPGLQPREKVGFMLKRALEKNPAMAVEGWILDLPDGGLQFDNGLCGSALLHAWKLAGDERALSAARRSADWAAAQPMVTNWNYNAFSVGLLARCAVATGEKKYLEAAIEKARVGVLPGQLPAGRWFDAHNACAVYHDILLRELLELAAALPPEHAFAPVLRDALQRGLDQAAEETLSEGYAGTWTGVFARGLVVLGENTRWRVALNVNLNATGRDGAPAPGFAIVEVLELASNAAR